MIVRNSASTLRECLQSAQPWFDEIIVVDTGSTDETVSIATSYGAKVSHFPWIDDFAAARNESLHKATGTWIFWMDADDTIDACNGQKLRELAANASSQEVTGFVIQVQCPNSAGDITSVDHVKLIRNSPDIFFEGRIHEQILPSIRRLNGNVAWSDIFVTHSGSDQTPAGQLKKRERDLRLLQLELAERPEHPFTLFNLGMTYVDGGEAEVAGDYLERCLKVSKASESHVRKAYALLAGAYASLNRQPESLRVCAEGLQRFPDDPELLFRRGLVLQDRGQLRDAEQAYLAALRPSSNRYFSSIDIGIRGYKTRHNLAVLYHEQGRFAASEMQWRAIIAERPNYQAATRGLADLLLEQGRLDEVQLLIDQANDSPRDDVGREVLRARLAEATGNPAKAREILERTSPDPEVLRHLARIHFSQRRWTEARAVLLRLTELEPEDGAAWHNLGATQLALDCPSQAVASVEQSLAIRPQHAPSERLLADAQLRLNDYVLSSTSA